MSDGGPGVLLAGRDPVLSVALRRSGLPVMAEVSQAELLFGAIDRCQPAVVVLSTDLEGTFDLEALVGNLAWLFPDLPVILVGDLDGQGAAGLPPAWRAFPRPPDYRRLVEAAREFFLSGPGRRAPGPVGGDAAPAPPPGGDHNRPPCPTAAAPAAGTPSPFALRGGATPPCPETLGSATGVHPGAAARTHVPPAWGWGGFPAPQVLTVCSPKGGVGKTFVAVNLAVAISSRGQEVLLLDWDLPSSDVSIHLNLPGGPGLLDLVNSGRDITPEALRDYLVRHPASGLYVLKGPSRPELAEFVGQEHLRSVLASARGGFPVVVIDTAPSPCDEALCQALEAATRIMLVVVQDPACLYQARVFLDLLPRLGVHRGAVGVLVNRYREGSPDVREIRAFLGLEPAALLPEDPLASRAIMQGVPYVLRHTGPLATAILELSQRVYPLGEAAGQVQERKRGWLSRASRRLRRP